MKNAAAVLASLFGLVLLLQIVFRLISLELAIDPAVYRPEEIPEGFSMVSEYQHTSWNKTVLVFHYERAMTGGQSGYFNLRVVSRLFYWNQAAAPSESDASGVWIEGLPAGRITDGDGTDIPVRVNLLTWEEGGVSLTLQSNVLDQPAMLRVARSVRGRD